MSVVHASLTRCADRVTDLASLALFFSKLDMIQIHLLQISSSTFEDSLLLSLGSRILHWDGGLVNVLNVSDCQKTK